MGMLDVASSAFDAAGKVGMMFLQDSLNRRASNHAFTQSMAAANTQYQRGAADLKAAGINPILAYAQPDAAPSGSALGVSAQNVDLVNSGLATGNAQATRELQGKQGSAASASAAQSMAGVALANQQREVAASQIPVNSATAAKAAADAQTSASQRALYDQQAKALRLKNEAMEHLPPAQRLIYESSGVGALGTSTWQGLKDAGSWVRDHMAPPTRHPKSRGRYQLFGE